MCRKPIDGGGGQQPIIGEGLVPFGKIEIAGDDRARLLVAFGDEDVDILVGRWAQGLEPKIIDDQQRNAREGGELALVGAGGARGVQACRELCAAGEQDIDALTDRAVPQSLGEMAFADADFADDEYRSALGDVAPSGRIMQECAVELRQSVEVELLEGLVGAEARRGACAG